MSQKAKQPYDEFFNDMCRRLANKDCKHCGGEGISNEVITLRKKGFRTQQKKMERYCSCLISAVMKYLRVRDMVNYPGLKAGAWSRKTTS